MRQWEAVRAITNSLKQDTYVQAVYLKGSMGRREEDEYSDVDLYVLVDEGDKEAFLKKRKKHLESYQTIIFYDDIFIIAPQIIAVYDNLLHIDLFTVTEETMVHKDFYRVLYDPEHRMDKHAAKQNLRLEEREFLDAVEDAAFFFLQYKKAADRGNDIWAVKVANDIGENLGKILLQKYCPSYAQLGLKAVDQRLPISLAEKVRGVYNSLSIDNHGEAIRQMAEMIEDQMGWLNEKWGNNTYTIPFLKRMAEEMKDRTSV
ncbi:nucleotidyltransferase domain-containing protein [Halobacillus karajensis]|uniref:Nucleotidyltransferases n=1 Tax=Halobacillus karajensis TaxID=195088 RepID=A0A024P6Q2_9BACI|nr:nucleotidyltransferase domain-containing protein [Halobacillus karajensis]CDQ20504.1 putative nucleotidyltransferases [Halobacillus karajensis]CDQ24027.1 putative nucleotidyltransferases [Halobacillus karajensis]CDQ27505.1 putative nucleotidyltransferases [Halobacillus karajensis]